MTSRPIALALDCVDVDRCAAFWTAALGTSVERRWDDAHGVGYVEIGTGGGPVLLLQPVPDPKRVKNRMHLDLAPVDGTQEQEVQRLVGLGATRVDDAPGQRWVVLADPEGNEFCVLPPRRAGEG
ncbi:VOC family protein [Pseudonocardia broussonetiae]|uniref:VOC family protein n=1 Tax=Pseudonocardia broussonetiae TaxID=2736640 RepID=A0A6M6JLS6_9PSEU|nr:VOC family protein [Pseudonocardia broussonetiae]QJY48163.1 VOC family protein [Pseudonocardia broussonetiae]